MSEAQIPVVTTIDVAPKVLPTTSVPNKITETAPQPEEEVKPPSPSEDPKFAARFAVLARREKSATQKLQEAEAKEQAVQNRIKQLEAYEARKVSAKDSPLDYLQEAGLTYEDLTNYILNDSKTTPESKIAQVEKKLQELEEATKKKEEEAEAARLKAEDRYIQNAIEVFKADMQQHIESNPEKYELILANNAQDEVWSAIETLFYDTGKIPDIDQVAQAVEDELTEQAKKLLSLRKFQPAEPKTPEKNLRDTSQDVRDILRPSVTLTNDKVLSTALPSSTETEQKPLSRDERIRRSAKLLRFISDE